MQRFQLFNISAPVVSRISSVHLAFLGGYEVGVSGSTHVPCACAASRVFIDCLNMAQYSTKQVNRLGFAFRRMFRVKAIDKALHFNTDLLIAETVQKQRAEPSGKVLFVEGFPGVLPDYIPSCGSSHLSCGALNPNAAAFQPSADNSLNINIQLATILPDKIEDPPGNAALDLKSLNLVPPISRGIDIHFRAQAEIFVPKYTMAVRKIIGWYRRQKQRLVTRELTENGGGDLSTMGDDDDIVDTASNCPSTAQDIQSDLSSCSSTYANLDPEKFNLHIQGNLDRVLRNPACRDISYSMEFRKIGKWVDGTSVEPPLAQWSHGLIVPLYSWILPDERSSDYKAAMDPIYDLQEFDVHMLFNFAVEIIWMRSHCMDRTTFLAKDHMLNLFKIYAEVVMEQDVPSKRWTMRFLDLIKLIASHMESARGLKKSVQTDLTSTVRTKRGRHLADCMGLTVLHSGVASDSTVGKNVQTDASGPIFSEDQLHDGMAKSADRSAQRTAERFQNIIIQLQARIRDLEASGPDVGSSNGQASNQSSQPRRRR